MRLASYPRISASSSAVPTSVVPVVSASSFTLDSIAQVNFDSIAPGFSASVRALLNMVVARLD